MLKHDHTKLMNFEPFKICVQLQITNIYKGQLWVNYSLDI